MTGKTVFVGGPIQYASNAAGNVFDDRLKEQLQAVHTVLRALGTGIVSAHIAEDFGAGHVPTPSEVTARDFGYMERSDVYLAVLPMSQVGPYRTDGTHIELGWATALDIPVVVLWDGASVERYSFLVRGLAAVGSVTFVDLVEFENDVSVLERAMETVGNPTVVRTDAPRVLA